MNTQAKAYPDGNPVLRLAARWAADTPVTSYRKGWQLAQRMLDQCIAPIPVKNLR